MTSSADNQLMMAPSPSRPARRNMPSRNAATRIGGCCSGTMLARNPLMSKLSNDCSIRSPAIADFKNRTTSLVRW